MFFCHALQARASVACDSIF